MKKKIPLASKKCLPCEGGVTPMLPREAKLFMDDIKTWRLTTDKKSIRCEWVMKDFMAAINLIGRIAKVAEKEDHHPDIHLTGYRKLAIELSTHAIGGLSENDFILAAKIDKIPKKLKI